MTKCFDCERKLEDVQRDGLFCNKLGVICYHTPIDCDERSWKKFLEENEDLELVSELKTRKRRRFEA